METTVRSLVSLLLVSSVALSVTVSALSPCKFDSLDAVPKSILNRTLPRGVSQNITLQACESGCTYVGSCVAIVFIPNEENASRGKCIHHNIDWATTLYKSEIGKMSEDVLIERKKCQKKPVPVKGVPRGCETTETKNFTTWIKEKGNFKATGKKILEPKIDGCKTQCQLNPKCDMFSRLQSSKMCVFLHISTSRFYYKTCNLQADAQICKMTQKSKKLKISVMLAKKRLGVTVEQCKALCMKDTRCTVAECGIENGANTCSLKGSLAVFGRTCDVIKGERCQLRKMDKPLTDAVIARNIPIPKVRNVNQIYQFCNRQCSRYCTQVKLVIVKKKVMCQFFTQQKALKKTCVGTTCSMTEVKTLKAQLPTHSVYHQVHSRPLEHRGVNSQDLCLKSHQCVGIVITPASVPMRRGNKIQNVVMPICLIHFRMEFKSKTCSAGKCVIVPFKNGTKITTAFENVLRTPEQCAKLCLTLKYCTAIAYTKIIKQCSVYGKSSLMFDDVYQKKCSNTGTCSMVKVPRFSFLYAYAPVVRSTKFAKALFASPMVVKPDGVSKCIDACRNSRQCSVLFLKFSLDKNMMKCIFLIRAPTWFGEKKCKKFPWAAKPQCSVRGPTRIVPFPIDSPNHRLLTMRTVEKESQCQLVCQQSTRCVAVMMWRLTSRRSGPSGQRNPQSGYGGYRGPQGGYGGQPSPQRRYGQHNTQGGYGRQYNPHAGYGNENNGGQQQPQAPGQHGYAGQSNPYGAAPARRRLLHYPGGYGAKPMKNGYGSYGHQAAGNGGNNYRREQAGYGGYQQRKVPPYGSNGYGRQPTGYGGQQRPRAYPPNSYSQHANSYRTPKKVVILCATVAAEPVKLANGTGDPTQTTSKILTPHVRTRIIRKNCTDAARNSCRLIMTEEFITRVIPDVSKYMSSFAVARKTPTVAMLEDCQKDPQCVAVVLYESGGKKAAYLGYDPVLFPKNCGKNA